MVVCPITLADDVTKNIQGVRFENRFPTTFHMRFTNLNSFHWILKKLQVRNNVSKNPDMYKLIQSIDYLTCFDLQNVSQK